MATMEKPLGEARFEETAHAHGHDQHRRMSVTDTEKAASSGYPASEAGVEHRSELARASRKLTRKIDLVLLTFTSLLYLAAYLDRGNLGNARLQGLEAEALDGSDDKYANALAMFYVTYICFSIPGTLLAKAWLPSRSIALGAFIWSVAASCQAAVKNPAGVYVCRLFVGIGEALFGQACMLYLSYWYSKKQLSKRVAFFIGAGAVAGAFGGLIAFGVSHINNSPIEQWRILFLIEGIPSLVLALLVFFFMPTRPDKSRFLNENERTLLHTTLNRDSLAEGHTGIDWRAVRYAFLDWRVYVMALIYSCINLQLGSVGGFLPTIVKGLGYTNADAQLYTVPPYAVALVAMLMLSWVSDRLLTRGIPVACVFASGIIGWAILFSVQTNLRARYFGVFCVVSSAYCAIPLMVSWTANNNPSQSQRAVALGMLNTFGQCLSVLASYIFPSSEGPKYVRGTSINIAFAALGCILALSMTTYFRLENRRRDKREGGRPPVGEVLNVITDYDKAVGFRFVH